MSNIAIRVDNLSKQYRLGQGQRSNSLRESLANALKAPWRRTRGAGDGRGNGKGTFWALKDVSFEVRPGEVVGIIGRNGAGKSTLLKILSRITEPTAGEVEINGRVGSLLEVGTGFHPELTGRENVYLNGAILGMRREEIAGKFDEIVAFAEVEKFIDTPVKHYSSGMYMRLAFGVAAHLDPEVLIVDEVLAVGDASFQQKCLGKMGEVAKRGGRAVLFVSHNMGAVQALCSSAVVLEQGRVEYVGGAEGGISHYVQNARRNGGAGACDGDEHVLYRNVEGHSDGARCWVNSVEILNPDGSPKTCVSTWDPVVVRVRFYSKQVVKRGGVGIEISQAAGGKVWHLASQPDSNFPCAFRQGDNQVDCVIPQLPLAAGNYKVGIALTVPTIEWLWRNEEVGTLTVNPRDVLGSGLPGAHPRTLIVVPHSWRIG